jgi:hypothetical protein
MYQRLEYGRDANAFIRLQLSRGPRLARLLCHLPLELGRVVAFLPPHVELWNVLHFAWLINTLDAARDRVDYEYRDKEHNVIVEYLKRGQGRAAVFYRRTAPPGKDFSKAPVPGADLYFYEIVHRQNEAERICSTEVYLSSQEPLTKEEVRKIPGSESMGLIAVLASLPDTLPQVGEDGTITEETLKMIASRTEMILVSAYDRDATLIWSRTELP